ncbi:hypothetical protein O6H91_03G005100 [Diphasiastrum complanatum]|uniref:Uncharacterized protein n=1 Tax=Diphasiastrum complanatum TaxID=34168 RepID=A0ACC2E2Z3_DIPCM|nr:hypothetical protein O6H91_Y158200 [Diphasiastrum complanatum]KAJ7560896.1 hypothetical protein O6H91_03G005100 [Diphasiastrum complanatum]
MASRMIDTARPFLSSISHFIANPLPIMADLPMSRRSDRLKLRAEQEDGEEQQQSEESFEERLARLQRRVSRGSGKKAERRKARKEGLPSQSAKGKSSSVLLAPVPLQDSVSDGLAVQLGLNAYAERLNGRLAALGLAAVLLVELASGMSFLKYHEPAIIGVQIYTVLAASALFVKYEKEKISIWPTS